MTSKSKRHHLQKSYHILYLPSTKKRKWVYNMENTISKESLQRLYRNYPDVVTLPQLCEMLGGIADSTARKLLRGDHIEHFVITGTYYIPKKYVINYVLGEHYAHYSKLLKAKLPTSPPEGGGGK